MFEYFSVFYYAVPVQLLVTLLFVVNGLVNYRKIKGLKILLLYGLVSLAQDLSAIYVSVYTKKARAEMIFVQSSINFFVFVEYVLFYCFIYRLLETEKLKYLLTITFAPFLCFSVYHWIVKQRFGEPAPSITIVEAFSIVAGCLFYFLQIFMRPPRGQLINNPSFWIIIGMLLLFAFLMPLFLHCAQAFMVSTDVLDAVYVMNSIGYIILFIFFNIGLRCQIRIFI